MNDDVCAPAPSLPKSRPKEEFIWFRITVCDSGQSEKVLMNKRETVQPMHPKPTWDKYALHYQYLSTEILIRDRVTHSPALHKNVHVDIEHIYMWTLHLHITNFSGV